MYYFYRQKESKAKSRSGEKRATISKLRHASTILLLHFLFFQI
ncbi:hypothetical protein HMPREF9396_2014 [Streptococcus sanguinis SK1059]|nr:hypothetical protein HMPREF9396_2014 [Streptococcus sanguinis SK1059]EGQ18923.1 hypothetical protein HMPREF8573_2065 [Streptococcus sanguinis ATCC 29667]EGQ25368.1 hypothetical protein HMPREF9387_0403 [Streptococcus sanguinis SK340]